MLGMFGLKGLIAKCGLCEPDGVSLYVEGVESEFLGPQEAFLLSSQLAFIQL
jgi:hypothetical protein